MKKKIENRIDDGGREENGREKGTKERREGGKLRGGKDNRKGGRKI